MTSSRPAIDAPVQLDRAASGGQSARRARSHLSPAGSFRASHRVRHDRLTGLPDRAAFAELLERSGEQAAVLLVDLDGFDRVNTTMGHAIGDELLVAVAGRLRGCLQPMDTIARVGDDEFAILLGRPYEAAEVATHLLENLRAPFGIRGRRLLVDSSIGIATSDSSDSMALRDADAALRQAKGAGGGRYQVFDQRLHDAAIERIELEGDLQHALERREFFLHYQPLVELSSGALVGVEALVRWMHPERGVVSPEEFIPLAEETGLVVPLGRWILRQACRQAAEWHRRHEELLLSVNLSGTQLDQPQIVDEVLEAIDDEGLDPRRLILEITETVLLHDTRETLEKLAALRAHGIRLAVDDFGTGYSSLQYLSGFPVDILKIAKPFVDGLRGAADGTPLARAIVGLGESFSVAVVGEGIEFAQQREHLIELGCRLGQGYLFAAPTDTAGIDALLARSSADGTVPGGPWDRPGTEPRHRTCLQR
jgi:diguanylate cyclase (GGDEF)-like protein